MSYQDAYDPEEGIAIIGLAGRFPGAADVDEFWRNLEAGRETIASFAPGELEPALGEEAPARADPAYVRARGILTGIDLFDAPFFGITPKEAEILDPQQRLFMEAAWHALENAGYDPRAFAGAIGVFAGMSNNTYFRENLAARADVTDLAGWLTTMMANEKDYLATRIAYKFDLRGPALNIQTACSTSLVAVCAAVQSLLTYQCDLALAGGVSITLPQRRGYLHQEGGITSSDGHCRTFDRSASGTVFSNGLGLVALRRLRDALADRDTIYAVIKGAGMNNDGSAKVSFTAPSVSGHAAVIALAQALSGIDPQTISYVEAHGTATPLGDPVELAGLTQAFRAGGADGAGFCAIGSVKSNVGHLDAAAGVAGLIKTALALHHKTLPASLHFEAPNPKLELESSPFRVVTAREHWQPAAGFPRRAAVSSFGVGGTNAHVVLEEAPPQAGTGGGDHTDDGEQLLVLSARSREALDLATSRLGEHLAQRGDLALADAAFTLQAGRRRFNHRRALLVRDRADALQQLAAAGTAAAVECADEGRRVAFLFPGQGSQAPSMARALYDGDPAFRADVDACAQILRTDLGFDLREVLHPAPAQEKTAAERLLQTAVTQPALFVVEYALARAWQRLGIEPDGMLGHSVGEYVAATLASVFTRDDALRLVAQRGQLMQALPPGAMLAVKAGAEAVAELLAASAGVEVAARNAPLLTVVSGSEDKIAAFEERVRTAGFAARRLATSHAFHSAMMEPILATFTKLVAATPRSAPQLPWVSSLTGTWITAAEAQSPQYWAEQLRRPVLFAAGAATLLADPRRVTLEVGPGQQLTGLVRQALPGRAGAVSLAPSLLAAAARLWTAGVDLDWTAFQQGAARRRVPLPGYPFERKRYWVEPGTQALPLAAAVSRQEQPHEEQQMTVTAVSAPARIDALVGRLQALFSDLSGMDAASLPPGSAFLELGLDSLFLTQAATLLQKTFGVKVTFRELLDELSTIGALAAHLDKLLPPDAAPVAPAAPVHAAAAARPAAAPAFAAAGGSAMERLIADQLELMRQQLDMMRGGVPAVATAQAVAAAPEALAPQAPSPARVVTNAPPIAAPVVAFGPYRPPAKGPMGGLTERQQQGLAAIIERYTKKTAGSKAATAKNRPHLADPRSVAGFRLMWKEMVYPIVTVRSLGSRLWDVDDNEYVDLTNGFGMIFFGHNPQFVRDAVKAQMDQGVEIGPQSPLAGEVAERVARMVGMDRVAFCNTGSEAVTAAIRLARTVSGRDKIAMFAGAYHGIFDEVLVRPAGQRSMPIAPGIPAGMVDNVVILDYGSDSALEYLKAHGSELAALLVEPVQSRRPDLQPREFLHEVRRLTAASGTALVFDEVVTGFRTHPGGAQAIFGIKADMATYGKVIGGGLPIGLITGRREYMDALDGGSWQYGDESLPEVGVTFFAGTFVRHPLALAAAKAVVTHLEEAGPELQRGLNKKTAAFAARLNEHAARVNAPVRAMHFSSWIYVNFPHDVSHSGLFHFLMRARGVHVWEGRCWFLTTSHTDADLDIVFAAFRDTLAELQAAEFLPGGAAAAPLPGARLGKDRDGKDAWFVPDPQRPGQYLQVEEAAPARG